jgi:hypothetical protein
MYYNDKLAGALQNATLLEAIEIIDRLIFEAQTEVRLLKSKRLQLEDLIQPNEQNASSPNPGRGSKKDTIPNRILGILEREGTLSWKELYSLLPDVRPGTAYAAVRDKLKGQVEIVKVVGHLDTVRLTTSTNDQKDRET